jgi:hypothetical protein
MVTAYTYILIPAVDPEEQIKWAGSRNLRVGNGEEVKIAFNNYHGGNKLEALECKVDKFLGDKGY